MDRRRFLTVSVVPIFLVATGCTAMQDQRAGLALSKLELENLTDEAVVFGVKIVNEADTQVFEVEELVSGESAVVIDQPVEDPGQYELKVTTGGDALDQEVSMFAKKGDDCVIAVARLDEAGRLRIEGNGYEDCTT